MYTIADKSFVVLFLEKKKPTADCIGSTSYHGDIQFSKRFPSNCLLLPSVTYGVFLVHEGAALWTAMASESIQKLSCSVLRPRTHRYHWKLVFFWRSFKNWTLPNCPLELWWWQAYWPESKATCNKHLKLWSKDLKEIHPKVLSHMIELISSLSSMVLFPSKPLLSSWATENQPTAWQSRQLSPLILGPIAAIAGCLSGYQGISSHIITCFSAASGAAPGGFFWGIWSCVFCSKPTWRLWVVETGDDYTELLFRWESCS